MITAADVAYHSSFCVSALASELGLAPGEWPETLPTTLGNGLPFLRSRVNFNDGELQSVEYFQEFGAYQLTVFNT